MPTRWIVRLLTFFVGSAALALAVAVFGPIPSIRFFGGIALVGALMGTALYLYLLRNADPDYWEVLRNQVSTFAQREGVRNRVMPQRHEAQA